MEKNPFGKGIFIKTEVKFTLLTVISSPSTWAQVRCICKIWNKNLDTTSPNPPFLVYLKLKHDKILNWKLEKLVKVKLWIPPFLPKKNIKSNHFVLRSLSQIWAPSSGTGSRCSRHWAAGIGRWRDEWLPPGSPPLKALASHGCSAHCFTNLDINDPTITFFNA